jgi:hypothetical protein
MIVFLIIGGALGILTIILSFIELLPFFKAVSQLNRYTNCHGIGAKLVYPIRLISLLPKAAPVLLDIGIAFLCGSIGLSGGVTGALIGLIISATASLLVKFFRHVILPGLNRTRAEDLRDWRLAHE